jgi:hypothetical protein
MADDDDRRDNRGRHGGGGGGRHFNKRKRGRGKLTRKTFALAGLQVFTFGD